MEIAGAAHRHGITEADMLHAVDNAINWHDLDDGFVMIVGPSRDGALIEVGIVDGQRIVQAMPARHQFL